jgi:hypothetical protein
MWGKFLFDLTVAGGILNGLPAQQLIDRSTGVQIIGPGGLLDIAVSEEIQFDPSRAWVGTWQDDLRILDAAIIAAATPFGGTPTAVIATTGSAGTPGSYATGNHSHQLTFTVLNSILAAASAAITVNGQTLTSGGFIGPYFATSVASPATTGLVRGSAVEFLVVGRNDSDTANVPLLSWGAFGLDCVQIGDVLAESVFLSVKASGNVQIFDNLAVMQTFSKAGGIAFATTSTFNISQDVAAGAGATATIKAQGGGATFAGGKLSLEAGDPGAGGAPTGIDLEMEASATVSGTLAVKGGAFGTLATIAYANGSPETTITLGPSATPARIDANELRLDAANIAMFSAAGDFGGGTGVINIANATTAPTSITDSVKLYATGKSLQAKAYALCTLMPAVEDAAGTEDLRAKDRRARRLTTTDATVTTAYTFAIPNNSAASFDVDVVAYTLSNGTSAVYNIKGGAKRFGGGNAALIGAPVVTTFEDNAAYDALMDISTTNVVIKVTGVVGTDVEWFVAPNVTLMQPA